MKKIFISLIALAVLVTVGAIVFLSNQIEADESEYNFFGWAWSDNIGWIEFPAEGSWGVNIEQDGTLEGWGWSDNIGWIKFDSPMHHSSEDYPEEPKQSAFIEDLEFGGWIRACSATVNGDCVSEMFSVEDSKANQWDGWIKLSEVEVDLKDDDLSGDHIRGKAWGSDVVGWVYFSHLDYSGEMSAEFQTRTTFFRDSFEIENFALDEIRHCDPPAGESKVLLSWDYVLPYPAGDDGKEIKDASYIIKNGSKETLPVNINLTFLPGEDTIQATTSLKITNNPGDILYFGSGNNTLELIVTNQYGVELKDEDGNYPSITVPVNPHAHPFPVIEKADRTEPEEEGGEECEIHYFIDYDGSASDSYDIPRSLNYYWTFGANNVDPQTSDLEKESVRYFDPYKKGTTKLEVTDSSGYSCYTTIPVNITLMPRWKEVAPFIKE